MSEKILLIDGYSILNRAYYGLPSLTSSRGEPTGGVYGFMNILYKMIDQEAPQYIAVAFLLCLSFRIMACSLPPPPTTSIFIKSTILLNKITARAKYPRFLKISV